MTRIVSYNILAGGYDMREGGMRRSAQIVQMLRPVQPDIVAVVEALHPLVKQSPTVLEEIGKQLGMQIITVSDISHCKEYQPALLTRLPMYVDAYRRQHPNKPGFTCPASAPSGRIDYIFTSPSLAERLTDCEVLRTGENGLSGEQASDHFPITAGFTPYAKLKASAQIVEGKHALAQSHHSVCN